MDKAEIVVVGGGLAGLTAGQFAGRCGRSTVVLTGGVVGGQLLSITKIEDFPGFPEGVAGYELCPMAEEQVIAAGADVRPAAANGLVRDGDGWGVATDGGDIRAGAVILATGSRFRELGVAGEERLVGKGVSHCASCDAPLFRGRAVAVVGAGDSALQEALELAEHGCEVVLLQDGDPVAAQAAYRERVDAHAAISVRAPVTMEEIVGDERVEAVRVRNLETGATELMEVAGVFPFVGLVPQTELLAGLLELEPSGYVVTDAEMRTALPGLLAAGDIRRDSARQAVAAAGDGATAALAAHAYLSRATWPSLLTTAHA